jgi:hypothetical protein
LTGKEEIKTLLDKKVSKSAIARILGVHRLTVAQFVKDIVAKGYNSEILVKFTAGSVCTNCNVFSLTAPKNSKISCSMRSCRRCAARDYDFPKKDVSLRPN